MSDREWKLGKDLSTHDNLLDEITFDSLILAVHHNCRVINEEAVRKEFRTILAIHNQDMEYLLENNMAAIIKAAKEGRKE